MNKHEKEKLPIGIENFEKLRLDDFYYIDKTGLIRELHQELTYPEIYQTIDNIWSLLFTTGYLIQLGVKDRWVSLPTGNWAKAMPISLQSRRPIAK